eukprot:7677057-Pyramimonas_sp.AAC.1
MRVFDLLGTGTESAITLGGCEIVVSASRGPPGVLLEVIFRAAPEPIRSNVMSSCWAMLDSEVLDASYLQ